MKIHRLAFEGFHRAYSDALLAPGDELAMRRFNAWAKAASRVLGVQITACASGSAHPRWVRVTASTITAAMVGHYAVDLARHPGNPTVPKPPASAVFTVTALTSAANTSSLDGIAVTIDRVTGQRIKVLPPSMPGRYVTTQKSTT